MYRPNILLIVNDCFRTEKTLGFPEDLGRPVLTKKSARTPFLDHLRSVGTTWSNYNSISSTTTPNFASMFTGLYPDQHGVREHSRYSLLGGKYSTTHIYTLAERLKDQGYNTYAEVSGPLIPQTGLNRGFDHYRHRDRTNLLHNGFYKYLVDFLPTMKGPWFLCLHLWEAHGPYNPGHFNERQFGCTPYDRAISNIENHLGRLSTKMKLNLEETYVVYTADHGERLLLDWELNRMKGGNEYKIFQESQQQPGPPTNQWFEKCKRMFGEHKARIYAHCTKGHGFHLFEDLIRVPLVISGPELYGKTIEHNYLCSQIDLMETILQLAEVPSENARSILRMKEDRKYIYIEANGSGGKQFASKCYLRGIKNKKMKYFRIEAPSKINYRCMYDLKKDPRETKNVIESLPRDLITAFDQMIDIKEMDNG